MAIPGEQGGDPTDILSPAELKSLRDLQNAYSARAKVAADELARLLELDDESRQRLIGQLGIRLAELDFEARRDVEQRLIELTSILGATAAGQHALVIDTEVVTLFPRPEAEPTEPVADDGPEPTGGDEPAPEPGPREIVPLSAIQKSWLGKLFQTDEVDLVSRMTMEERRAFTDKLGEIYVGLKVTRVSKENKQRNAQSLKGLMTGKSYKKMAEELDVQERTLWGAVNTMAGSISQRVAYEDLQELVKNSLGEILEPTAGDDEPGPEDDNQQPGNDGEDLDSVEQGEHKPNALNQDVERWYTTLYNDEEAVVDNISELSAEQQVHLAELFGTYVRAYLPKDMDPDIRRARANEAIGFLSGISIPELAKARNLPELVVRENLQKVLNIIKRREPADNLIRLVSRAQEFIPQKDGDA